MNLYDKANANAIQISELYEEFKVLKDYLDSNKKIKSQLHSTPKQENFISDYTKIPDLLATPETKKVHKGKHKSTTRKQKE